METSLTKICKHCNNSFNKLPKTGHKFWDRQLCCSQSCAAKYRGSPWLEKHKIKKGQHIGKKTEFKKGELRGFNNVNWKGNKVGYEALHSWAGRTWGKPQFCEHCKTSARRMYHWANISREYKRDRDDWLRLCVPCHTKYDSKPRV